MRIRLDRIGDEPFKWREARRLPPSILERPEVVRLGEIAWRGRITRTGAGFLFQAELSYEQALTCQRCLAVASRPVEAEVELLLVESTREPLEGEHELEQEELNVYFVEDHILDTEPVLLEQVQLNVPMRPLCRETCAGLCPVCGTDRNLEECRCEEQTVDPRWSVLRTLGDALED